MTDENSHPLLTNKKEYLQSISKMMGKKVYDGEIVAKNDVFKRFEDLDNLRELTPFSCHFIADEIHTLVEDSKGFYLKIQPYICLWIEKGAMIRFAPHKADGLEICRIQVTDIGQGVGSDLMNIFLYLVSAVLGYIPQLYLECTGSVGWNENEVSIGISRQTAFFRKFGFRVNNRSKYPHWVDMIRPADYPPEELLALLK